MKKSLSSALKIGEAAKSLGISIDTLRRWERSGKIIPQRTEGGTRVYSPFVKIGEAAKILGVSIDTLRRWERAGKIAPVRTPGSTRLYSLEELRKLTPATSYQLPAAEIPSTLELLQKKAMPEPPKEDYDHFSDKTVLETIIKQKIEERLSFDSAQHYNLVEPQDKPKKIYAKIYASAILGIFVFVLGITLTVFFLSPEQLKNLNFLARDQKPENKIEQPTVSEEVLAASTIAEVGKYLEVNADTVITGNLAVNGESIFGEGIIARGSITAQSSIAATGSISTISTLSISGLSTLTGGLTTPGKVTLTNNAAETLLIKPSSDPTSATKLFVIKNASDSEKASIDSSGNTTFAGTLKASGATTLSSTLEVSGATTLSSTLKVSGATTLSSTLEVSGSSTLSGAIIGSTAGAASTPGLKLTGKWYTGGTTTTTKPQLLIEPTDTTTNNWSTSGTGLGINATSGFSGNLLDLQVAASRVFRIDSSGNMTTSGIFLAADGTVSAPAYSFSADTDTGIYRSASNTLDFSSGGVRTLTLATATSGVNYISITPAATGSGPTLASAGSDTNIPLNLNSAGTGSIVLTSANATSGTTSSAFVLTANSLTSGTGLYLSSSGTLTGTLASLVANSATTGTLLSLSGTGLTTGEALDITTTHTPTAGGTQSVLDLNFTNAATTTANTLRGIDIALTDATSLANTLYGIYVDANVANTAATKYAAGFVGGTVLQTPTNPTYVGGADNLQNSAVAVRGGIFVSGRYAYLMSPVNTGTCSSSDQTGCELQIWDVSIPSSPTYKGGADLTDGGQYVFVVGRYAYLTKIGNSGTCNSTTSTGCEFQIWDISNPSSPAYVGGGSDGGNNNLRGVSVSGRYAYIGKVNNTGTCSSADSTGCEFQIWDISNPTSPTFVGGSDVAGTDGAGNAITPVVVGKYAYIAKGTNTGTTCSSSDKSGCELQIYDVSSPSNPTYVGGADINNGDGLYAWEAAISGRYAYVTRNASSATCSSSVQTGCEFQIWDISNPASPSYVGGIDNAGGGVSFTDSNFGLFVSGRYAYVTKNGNTGTCTSSNAAGCELQVYDVSSPTAPSFVGGADDGSNAGTGSTLVGEIFISGRYAYLSKRTNTGTCSSTTNTGCELQVYDISGVEATSVLAHSFEGGSLQVRDNGIIQNQLTVGGGLGVGIGGIQSQGSLSSFVNSASTTADSILAADLSTDVTGIITTGTRSIYGLRSRPAAGAESTGGTTNVYGIYSQATGDVAAGGTLNAYGLYVANGTYDTDGTSTNYGIYVEARSGADTNVDLAFAGTAPIITVGNTGTLSVTDGTNTLFSIADDTSEGDVTVTGDLAVNGATSADITSSTTTATVFNTTVTTLSIGGAATTFNIGTTDSVTRTINLGTGTGADTINIGTGGTTADAITLGNTGVATTLTFNTGATTGTGFTLAANSVTTGTAESIAVNSLTTGQALDLSSTSASWTSGDLIQGDHTATYTSATTVSGNLLDLSRALTINAGATTLTVNSPVVSITDNCTVTAGTCTHTGGLMSLTQSFASSTGTVLALSNAGTGMTISVTDDDLIGLGTAAGRLEFDDQTIDELNILAARVGIGTSTPTSVLHVDQAIETTTATLFARAFIDNTNAVTTNTGNTDVYGLQIDEPNITVGTATPTNSASLYISAAATEATNNYALWVDAGAARFDGQILALGGNQVAAPPYSFQGDTDTGIYAQSAGRLDFSMDGVLRYSFTPNTFTFERPGVSGGATGINMPSATHTAVTVERMSLSWPGDTVTITGGYSLQRFTNYPQGNITAASALTVTTAANVNILGPVSVQGSALVTDNYALRIGTDGAGSGSTNAYGLGVAAPTGATNNYAAVFTGGNVGIGDTSPAALLSVGSGDLFQVNSNGSITQAQSAVSGGQVAVSLTPGAHTAVTAEVSDLAMLAHTITITGAFTSQRFNRFMIPTISAATALTVTNAATLYVEGAPATAGVGPAAITNPYALWVDAGVSRFDGDVVVGTFRTPQTRLEVNGTISSQNDAQYNIISFDPSALAAGVGGGISFGGIYTGTTGANVFASIKGIKENATDGNLNTALVFVTRPNGNPTERVRIDSSGNLGIGTITAEGRLDVDGAAQTVTAVTQRAIINNTNAITTNTGATAVYGLTIDEPNITVGTLTPTNSASLYISGAATEATNNYALWVDAGDVRMDGLVNAGLGSTASTTAVCSSLAGATAPTAGTAYELRDCSGTPVADYMEMYSVEQGMEPGDVVVPGSIYITTKDGERLAKLTKSSSSYQPQIIGIISDPVKAGDFNSIGHNIDAADNPMPIALNGRVYVKVSTENGPIERGDYLTSSSVPGVAMKATKPGPTVGKALEAFSGEGVGKILTFVNISFADPSFALANLLLDSNGNLVIPKVKTASLQLGEISQISPMGQTEQSTALDVAAKLKVIDEQIATQSAYLAKAKEEIASASAELAKTKSDIDLLKLTPPEILLATGSATLANLTATEILSSKKLLTALDVTVSGIFKALGEAILPKTIIAGGLVVDGTFSIDQGIEINTIPTLYIQKNALASSLDILNGKFIFNKEGKLVVAGVVEAKQFAITQGGAAGTAKILAGQTEAVIENSFVKPDSIIILTPETEIYQNISVVQKLDGKSFKVKITSQEIKDITFSYLIIGQGQKVSSL